jgi:hypothetical protein
MVLFVNFYKVSEFIPRNKQLMTQEFDDSIDRIKSKINSENNSDLKRNLAYSGESEPPIPMKVSQ